MPSRQPADCDAPPDNTEDAVTLELTALRVGTNVIAVAIHQQRADSSDLSFDLSLEAISDPAAATPPGLYWGVFGGQLVLAWDRPRAVLEAANAVQGPWTRIDAGSPYAVTNVGASRLFRIIAP